MWKLILIIFMLDGSATKLTMTPMAGVTDALDTKVKCEAAKAKATTFIVSEWRYKHLVVSVAGRCFQIKGDGTS